MNKILFVSAFLLSTQAFSQSYLILNNGVTLTTDKDGIVYDFSKFNLPSKVSLNGGQFFVEDKKLSTVDSAGFLYEKDFKVEKIKGKGLNYFINNDNELITIDSQGFYFKFDKEGKVFKKAVGFGGKFFTVKPDDKKPEVLLYTVSDKGTYTRLNVEGLNPADISFFGGTYFQTKDGSTYTVSNEGFVFVKPDIKAGTIKRAGGNFFIDSTNLIYTVSSLGILSLPSLPMNFSVGSLEKFGANYVIDREGRLFAIDGNGAVFERVINHDLKNTKVISF